MKPENECIAIEREEARGGQKTGHQEEAIIYVKVFWKT